MDAKSHSLHFLLFIAMCCKMHAQTICPSKCIVAWVAVVLFFSTVCSQMLLEVVCITWIIITNVALLHIETVSLRNVALWYSMCSRKTLSNIYHTKCALAKHCHIFTTPNTVKMCWNGFSPECFLNAPLDFRQMRMQSHTGCISLEWRTTLSLLRWPRQACDFSKLVFFPHISQEFLLLPFSSGWDASQVSEKQKQRCPSRSRFGADCSGISGSPCYHCNFGFIFQVSVITFSQDGIEWSVIQRGRVVQLDRICLDIDYLEIEAQKCWFSVFVDVN